MPQYKAPLRDIDFVLNDLLDYQGHYAKLPGGADATPDVVDAIIKECAKFCEEVLAPLNQTGDSEGAHWNDGKVTTPKGFKEAYDQFVAGGWQSLSHPVEYGGQGLPLSLSVVKAEFVGTANWSWGMYPGLAIGAMNTILLHGTEQQKQTYITKLITGEWSGTMCLTEPQCGTDLGQVKTRAEPNADGSYSITGTKIFISGGDHDLTDNIVHIVLARLPDAPAGTRGISLFIVPKHRPDAAGNTGEFNNVHCGSIEHKMGIKASATCVMNFEGATGYLIGPPNKGLQCMFTFMNTARVGTSVQGLGCSELAYQGALPYAKERLSMRALSGKTAPDKVADPLISHGDVRRMLLTQKAFAEGGRAMIYYAAKIADYMMAGETQEDRDAADDHLGFMTPILKAFLTETGLESANIGMQVYGGHGYIKEWGMEQIVRDARISTLYEGTTGIQALDLLGRKILLQKGKSFRKFSAEALLFCKNTGPISGNPHKKEMSKFIWPLFRHLTAWQQYTLRLALRARKDREIVSCASVDYLMYAGYIVSAYMWAMMAQKSYEKLAAGTDQPEFYKAKIQTAEFYFERILPRTKAHAESMMASSKTLMQMEVDHFSFL
ncbi:Acyl-CoA dehydrogenase [gamma proteobacterium HdN1]|nr:Acyl-CoA dehydrogenase [gamma proteobacterium HdN1]